MNAPSQLSLLDTLAHFEVLIAVWTDTVSYLYRMCPLCSAINRKPLGMTAWQHVHCTNPPMRMSFHYEYIHPLWGSDCSMNTPSQLSVSKRLLGNHYSMTKCDVHTRPVICASIQFSSGLFLLSVKGPPPPPPPPRSVESLHLWSPKIEIAPPTILIIILLIIPVLLPPPPPPPLPAPSTILIFTLWSCHWQYGQYLGAKLLLMR